MDRKVVQDKAGDPGGDDQSDGEQSDGLNSMELASCHPLDSHTQGQTDRQARELELARHGAAFFPTVYLPP